MAKRRRVKTLFYDIETSLMKQYTFSIDGYNTYKDIIEDWKILCASYSWDGDNKIYAVAYNEKKIVEELTEVVEEADIIVHHYGSKFDYTSLQARAAKLTGCPLPPLNQYNSVDTCKAAQKYFRFTSSKLDYLAAFFEVGRKRPVDKQLWRDVDQGVPGAMPKMIKYNMQDVRILKKVYKKMAPWLVNHPSHKLILSGIPNEPKVMPTCRYCFSKRMWYRGTEPTKTRRYIRYQCAVCKKWDKGVSYVKEEI